MKAIVFEDYKGAKNFLPFASEKQLFEAFKKLSRGSGAFFCTTQEHFNELKECYEMSLTDFIYKDFHGIGMYDWDGNFYPNLLQPEGTYSIEEYAEKSNSVKVEKITVDQILLN